MSARKRSATVKRKTAETDIKLQLDIDGSGVARIDTGIGFFDHMLTLLTRHALMNITLEAKGDLEVDYHHTVEDVGIVLGQALVQALGDKKGIRRYGHAYVPMDECLSRVVIDLSGRSFLEYRVNASRRKCGDFPLQLMEEFMRALSNEGRMNLHIEHFYGRDAHHMAESVFKALARALGDACRVDPRVKGIPSTKELL